jgi:FkbM family methyltransferase
MSYQNDIILRQQTALHNSDALLGQPAESSSSSSSLLRAKNQELQSRLDRLERKLNTFLAFDSDPFLNNKITSTCPHKSTLTEYCKKPDGKCDMGDMPICLDDIPKTNCIVYDFGIRNEPDFGVILAQEPFNCQVYAFDPSPITRTWFEENQELKSLPNYHLYYYGGGAHDEELTLRAYDWGQVSIYQYPTLVVNPTDCYDSGPYIDKCKFHKFGDQEQHKLPVRSVASIMKELGHTEISILKLDVEGSEYRILETLIDSGTCQNITQLTLEWHHFGYDLRYGHGSDPHLNLLHRLLDEECGLHQFALHSPTGWPSNEKIFASMNLPLYYNLASFRRGSGSGSGVTASSSGGGGAAPPPPPPPRTKS